MKTKFDSSDFELCSVRVPAGMGSVNMIVPAKCAEQANAKLEEIKAAWMEELEASGVKLMASIPTAAGKPDVKGNYTPNIWSSYVVGATHEALLINIREIKPPCDHPPKYVGSNEHSVVGKFYHCTKCGATDIPEPKACEHVGTYDFNIYYGGKRLVARWEIAE